MSEIDDLLGVDTTDPRNVLAEELVGADFAWVSQLVNLRKQLGLSQAQVAVEMGRTQSVVSDIETMSSDPRLSTLRRYALAIGAAVHHMVLQSAAQRPPGEMKGIGSVTARPVSAGVDRPTGLHSFYVTSRSPVEVGVR